MESLTDLEVKKLTPHIKIIAKKYRGYNVPEEDLFQEGVIGVYKAKEHYDKSVGGSFTAYAIWWIKQSILNALSEQSKIVHLPFGKINLFRKIAKIKDLYLQEYGREATELETRNELQISQYDYSSTTTSNTISLDQPISDSEDLYIRDILKYTSDIELKIDSDYLIEILKKSIKKLDSREQFIINNFFGIGVEKSLTLEELGEQLSLTRERCRQIKQSAIEKLKNIVPIFFDY